MSIIKIPDELAAHKDNYPNIRPHPISINIDNWRYIKYGIYREHIEVGKGCYVLASNLFFIPGVIPDQLFHVADSDLSMQAFFFHVNFGGAWCHRCHGAGRLTWIENAKGQVGWNAGTTDSYNMRFERDPNVLYSYNVMKNTGTSGRELFLSASKVEEGELLCRDCKGTGLWLNATTHLFQGFRNIKPKIYDTKRHPLYDTTTMQEVLSKNSM